MARVTSLIKPVSLSVILREGSGGDHDKMAAKMDTASHKAVVMGIRGCVSQNVGRFHRVLGVLKPMEGTASKGCFLQPPKATCLVLGSTFCTEALLSWQGSTQDFLFFSFLPRSFGFYIPNSRSKWAPGETMA